MEHKTIGDCKYNGGEICWDEDYVRLFIAGEEPYLDSEEFAHLDCYLKTVFDFIKIREKLVQIIKNLNSVLGEYVNVQQTYSPEWMHPIQDSVETLHEVIKDQKWMQG